MLLLHCRRRGPGQSNFRMRSSHARCSPLHSVGLGDSVCVCLGRVVSWADAYERSSPRVASGNLKLDGSLADAMHCDPLHRALCW